MDLSLAFYKIKKGYDTRQINIFEGKKMRMRKKKFLIL